MGSLLVDGGTVELAPSETADPTIVGLVITIVFGLSVSAFSTEGLSTRKAPGLRGGRVAETFLVVTKAQANARQRIATTTTLITSN